MDLNLVVLAGRVVAPPELVTDSAGVRTRRFQVSARTSQPRRLDVIRVVEQLGQQRGPYEMGDAVVVVGRIQREFRDGPVLDGSRYDVAAWSVTPLCLDPSTR